MKRKLSLLLALLMLAGTAVSCASENPESGNEAEVAAEPAAEETVPEVEEEVEKPFLDNLPDDLNFGGTDFNMLFRSSREADMFAEELTGEIVTDAVYERTVKLEDRLGVTFRHMLLPDDSGQWRAAISGSVSASDGAYDVVCPDYWWGIENGGYYINLMALPYLDFSQPYWCAGWNNNDMFFGKLYTAVGSWSLDMIVNTEAVFFNKKLLGDYALEDPYELVKENRWTADQMISMSETALLDVNGDGKFDPNNDTYGLIYNLHGGRGLMYAMGMKLAYQTEDGSWSVDYFNDHFVEIYEKMYNIHNNTASVAYGSNVDMNGRFASDNLLFLVNNVGSARGTELREMDSDFGLVPYPKYDENQEDFISFNLGTAYAAVLKSAKNPEMSAAVLEALCAENHKSVVPALYEDALKEKYARDPKTAEMLDLIQSTLYFDFTFVNDAALGALCNLYFDSVVSKSENVSSIAEKNKKPKEKMLAKLLESYENAE